MRRSITTVLLLFAGFAIAINIATALHEAGHAAGCWLTGGRVIQIVLRPFAQSLTETSCVGSAPTVWGGVGFGTAAAVVVALVSRWRPPGTLPWVVGTMTGALGLGLNGLYLSLGSVQPFDDAANMIALGAPRLLLFVLGLPLIAAFVGLLADVLRFSSLTPADPFQRWVAVTEGGFLSYPAIMIGYAGFIAPPPRPTAFMSLAFLTCFGASFFAVAGLAYSKSRRQGGNSQMAIPSPQWPGTLALLAIAMLIVVGELAVF